MIVHQKARSKRDLEYGKSWIEASLKIEEHPENLRTYAVYFYYRRKRKKAILYIEKAIRLAKENGKDTGPYEYNKRFFLEHKPPKLRNR